MGKGGSQVFLTFLGSSVLKQWSLPLLHCMRSEREREGEMYLHFSYTLIQIFVTVLLFFTPHAVQWWECPALVISRIVQ